MIFTLWKRVLADAACDWSREHTFGLYSAS
jgi:hypothetical protein